MWKGNNYQQQETQSAIFKSHFSKGLWSLECAIRATETDNIDYSSATLIMSSPQVTLYDTKFNPHPLA